MSETTPPSEPQGTSSAGASVTARAPEATGDAADIEKNRVMGILAYLGILVLVPILAAKESRFAKYHANQGVILFGAEIVIGFVLVFARIVVAFIPVFRWALGCIFALVSGVIWLAILAYVIMGIVNAVNGKCKPLPGFPEAKIIK